MRKTIHRANERGHAEHGWLDAWHSFSFAGYHDPQKVHFGALRVLNDDTIAGGQGFGTHPHDNMEIITIPLKGALAHKDSMGNGSSIRAGEIQIMSAGTGILHSEFNDLAGTATNILQIWVFPNKKSVTPRYQQIAINLEPLNQFHQIVSPDPEDEGGWIHQNAWFSLGSFDSNRQIDYEIKDVHNGVYVFMISGAATIAGTDLNEKDALGLSEIDILSVHTKQNNTRILLIDVPMQFTAQ